ncbi:RagB/SusD family nutrient uptake outer membrane protein [Sphingobacterium sp. LRF_L2]|uniref:RagB/SusD family nutrient uptake outer membrane protein n=1 Tax=Sphingobacterium sp. LRF_L2 TaxID=3369421 RepID=UPI003F61E108
MENKINPKLFRIILLCCSTIIIGLCNQCKDYLRVEPIDRLTGNNFYLSKADVESNLTNIYATFFDKINETWVMGATGEARSGEIFASPNANNFNARKVVEVLGDNDLLSAINVSQYSMYNLSVITDWTKYYQVIQSVNILLSKLEEGIPGVSGTDKNRYVAEATFIRCFTYFWMIRLYGDVVYYTEPYFAETLPRESMVSVLSKCIADLEAQKDLMPWSFTDPAERGARPARGAIIALLMHMNMWSASFDPSNKQTYYEKVASLGKELINSGVHRLYDMTDEEWSQVTKGRSEESLFEFYKSINYGDNVSGLAPFWDSFLRWPYKFPRYDNNVSHCYFISTYLNKIYPEDVGDKRRTFWFEDINADNGQFVLRKFATNIYAAGNEDKNPDNSFIIFRYADAILLYAEALAELDRVTEAITAVNMVRKRAEATFYDGGGGADLKNFIYLERCRELIGEAHRYFDLIRTRRIMNSEWTMAPMTLDQYNRGAWTWPIASSARNYNPKIVLNEYWTTTGR